MNFKAWIAILLPVALLNLVSAENSRILIDVPFVYQEKNGCGAASISMVLQYWERKGFRRTAQASLQDRIMDLLYSKEKEGIGAQDMVRYFERCEYRAYLFRGDQNMLLHHLNQGRPLIAALREEEKFHYVVVAGMDIDTGILLVNDPARRKLFQIRWETFDQKWSATENWTLLAVPELNSD